MPKAADSNFEKESLSQVPILPLPGSPVFEGHKVVFEADCVGPPLHRHKFSLLVRIYSGKVSVQTPSGVIPLSPGDFFFTPANCPHTEIYQGITTVVGLIKIPDAFYPKRPKRPTAIAVPPLLSAMYDEIISWGEYKGSHTPEQERVIEVFKDNLASIKLIQQFTLMFPKSGVVLEIAKRLLRNPGNVDNLDAWAKRARMSRRSFSRAFRDATGLSFMQWRQRMKIAVAIRRLSNGEQAKEVGYSLGFRNPSHFSREFKTQTGVSPGKFFKDRDFWNLSLAVPKRKTSDGISWISGKELYSWLKV